jgi:predicted regulator of Ras-like GTPase activity (Roadblock/LC7/MglB family)
MVENGKNEKLSEILKKLKQSGGMESAAVITRDGLLVASELSESVDGETLAAMTATMTGAAETAMSELKKKEMDRIIVESSDSKLISMGAGKKAIIVCMVSEKAKLGFILLEMEKASKQIEGVVGK